MRGFKSISKKIAIIGYGGFAREIAANLPKNSYDFFINKSHINDNNEKYVNELEKLAFSKYEILIAIGEPNIRKDIYNSLPSSGVDFHTYIDKNAVIMDTSGINIGHGSIITAGSILTTNINIGICSHININSTIGHDCIIGEYFTTAPSVSVSGNCNIGNNVYVGTGCVIREKINICDDVTLGMNCVVTKHISESGIYIGIPSKKLN